MKRIDKKKKAWLVGSLALIVCVISGIWYYQTVLLKLPETNTALLQQTEVTPEITKALVPEATPTPQLVYVYLCGSVKQVGVYTVPEGSRLVTVLELAGGFLEEAAKEYHNLARVVFDGERIYVPSKEEVNELSVEQRVLGEQGSGLTTQPGRININTADAATLMTIPGIGQAKADDIIEYRTKIGLFSSIEEIMNVSGIGEAMFEKMKDVIVVSGEIVQ